VMMTARGEAEFLGLALAGARAGARPEIVLAGAGKPAGRAGASPLDDAPIRRPASRADLLDALVIAPPVARE